MLVAFERADGECKDRAVGFQNRGGGNGEGKTGAVEVGLGGCEGGAAGWDGICC